MTVPPTTALAELAASFPGWHIWRSRDSRGRHSDWNATRHKTPRPTAPGIARRITASDAIGLHELLEQQEAAQSVLRAA
jgi:hypothetical protein